MEYFADLINREAIGDDLDDEVEFGGTGCQCHGATDCFRCGLVGQFHNEVERLADCDLARSREFGER